MKKPQNAKWREWLQLVAILSGISLILTYFYLPGTFIDGNAEGDKYFLMSAGELVEVSRAKYRFSQIHHAFTVVLVILAMLVHRRSG